MEDARMRIVSTLLGVVIALAATGVGAEETDPQVILEKAAAAYKAIDTYEAEGTATSDIDSAQGKFNIVTEFTIRLKKPNLYRISWEQSNATVPAMNQSGAVWSDGTQAWLYMGVLKAYSKMPNDAMAIGGATGVSGGAAYTIPSMLLNELASQPSILSRLVDPKLVRSEEVDGDDCYVIEASSIVSKLETLWISKESFLIEQCAHSMEPPDGGFKSPEMTEEQLAEAIEGLGQKVTEENKQALRKRMEEIQKMMQAVKLKGTMSEHYTSISTPELTEADFAFEVPEGVVLKESLFGDFLKNGLKDFKPPKPRTPDKPDPVEVPAKPE